MKFRLKKEGLKAWPLAEIHTRFKVVAVRSKSKLGSFETVPLRVRRLGSRLGELVPRFICQGNYPFAGL